MSTGSRKAVAFGKRILAAITRFVLEQQALEEVNRTFLESDVMDDSTYNDSYIFSDDGISYNIQVPEDKIGLVIGSKGSTVKEIREKTGCRIEMVKDALRPGCTWTVSSANSDAADEAVAWIQELISEPPLGSMHDGVVSKVVDYGVLVSFGRREGLIRLSHLSNSGTLNRGDQVRVSITGIDHRSRICLALADSVETTRAIPRPGPSRRAPAPAEAVHREIASAEKSVNANVLSNSVDNVVSTPWPSLGGSEERTVSVGQYAAWSQRVKEQRERARSEAEMRKVGPWSARETVGCAPAASEASSRPTQSADSPRRNVVDVVRSTSQGAAAATSASNVRVRRDSGPESMSSPKVRAAADFDADERGLNGMMPQGAGSRARTEWPGRDGVANGYASNVAVTRDVAVTRVTAASDVAVTRHLPHASDVAVTRRDLKGDADYSRDYTRYAPSAAAPGGTVSAGRGGRVQRMSDRDGGEEGGAFVVPSSGMRGRGRGRDF
jgi:predicted RNA-binding protein with RPS1 domain